MAHGDDPYRGSEHQVRGAEDQPLPLQRSASTLSLTGNQTCPDRSTKRCPGLVPPDRGTKYHLVRCVKYISGNDERLYDVE